MNCRSRLEWSLKAIADCATNVVDATVDAFMRKIAWDRVMKRFAEARG